MNDNIRTRSVFVLAIIVCSSLCTWFVVGKAVNLTNFNDWAVLAVIASACFFFKESFHDKEKHELGMIIAVLCASASVAVLFELRSMNTLYLAIIVIGGLALFNGCLTGNLRKAPSFHKQATPWSQLLAQPSLAQTRLNDDQTMEVISSM